MLEKRKVEEDPVKGDVKEKHKHKDKHKNKDADEEAKEKAAYEDSWYRSLKAISEREPAEDDEDVEGSKD